MPVGSLILLSSFAFLGIYFFVHLLVEELFCADAKKAVTVILLGGDLPVELAAPSRGGMLGERIVAVDLSGGRELRALHEKNPWCDAVTTPETLSETVLALLR